MTIGTSCSPSHPTVKPVLMIADAIRDVTKRGDIVLDTFMGSGSTLMAAEETGRSRRRDRSRPALCRCRGPTLAGHTRRDAVHTETGEPFDVRAKRLAARSKEDQHGQLRMTMDGSATSARQSTPSSSRAEVAIPKDALKHVRNLKDRVSRGA